MADAGAAPAPARTVLVTGASSGIGRALALGLGGAGLDVALLARNGEELEAVSEEIVGRGAGAAWAIADVRDGAAVRTAVAQLVDRIGPIDLLVNNAGAIDTEVPLWEADSQQWEQVVATNLIGSFHVSRAVLPSMVERGGGREVDIVSGAGARDWNVASAYTASKAALIRQVGHLHEAGFHRGLRAFAVAPGTVETRMSTGMVMHRGRRSFTPVERTVDLVAAIGRGELDAWSGRYLRVTHDSPASLLAHGELGAGDRRLGIYPWGIEWDSDDPNLAEGLVPPR